MKPGIVVKLQLSDPDYKYSMYLLTDPDPDQPHLLRHYWESSVFNMSIGDAFFNSHIVITDSMVE